MSNRIILKIVGFLVCTMGWRYIGTYIILSKNCYQIIDQGFWIYINLKFRWRYLCRSAFLSGLFILPIFDNAKLSSWIMLSSLSWRSKSRMHHRFVSSKFYCIWLIFRKIALDQGKKSSATSKMSPMGSFRMFPHHITWKADFWKVSRKPHLEYSHGFLIAL